MLTNQLSAINRYSMNTINVLMWFQNIWKFFFVNCRNRNYNNFSKPNTGIIVN